jgi:glycosyltransferase involved in cell wall biosynthesis
MNILHISTNSNGGAANAAFRLHESLIKSGFKSSFLTLENSNRKITNHFQYDGKINKLQNFEPSLTLKNWFLEKFLRFFSKKNKIIKDKEIEKEYFTFSKYYDGVLNFTLFSYPNTIYDITSTQVFKEADVIHLHWVANFLDYESFFSKIDKPIIWTLHDENPYLGGFHYQDDVDNNKITHGDKEKEFVILKERLIQNYDNITVVSPSNWIANKAKNSSVFKGKRVKIIRNLLNSSIFKQRDKNLSRELFNLPLDKKIILIASQDLSIPRKGGRYVEELLKNKISDDFLFVVAGSNFTINKSNVISIGTITDEILISCLYSAADYFLLPSLLDNLPNTLLESLFCGTPVIAFKIGDFEEIFQGNDFGVLVDEGDVSALCDVLHKIHQGLLSFDNSLIVKKALTFFSEQNTVNQYFEEYSLLLNK